MKKKLLIGFLAGVSSLALTFGLSACNDSSNNAGNKWGNVYTIEAAYAEASDLGYSGTLEDFIKSISGKDGKDGVGVVGIYIVSDSLVITLSDGTLLELGNIKGAQGEKGDKGDKGETGAAGKDGADGLTPYIGENGNWWIGSTDTGVLASSANENPQELDFYLLDDGTYAVGVGNAQFLSNVEIPSTYKGRAVTAIAENGFKEAKNKSITIPDSVTTIGKLAFSNCTSLKIAIFNNTNGWWIEYGPEETSRTSISSEVLADSVTAAQLIRGNPWYIKRA